MKDSSKRFLFVAKYRDILLIKDKITMIVIDVKFDDVKEAWELVAKKTMRDKLDNREYLPDPTDTDETIVPILGRKDNAGPLIKAFNNKIS